jgi:hypothetical protein
MPLGNPVYIEAPTVAPAAGGLYAVAQIRDNADVHIGASGAQYLSENCGVSTSIIDPACITAEARAEKTFGEIDVISSAPFAVYKGVQCTYMGDDDTDWARRGLETTEHIAVEEYLATQVFPTSLVNLTPTPGTPVSVVHGIAILEQYANANYGGVPTFHMDRHVAALGLAGEALTFDLTYTITSKQGSLVANGGGYGGMAGPSGVPAGVNQAWIYVTGAVVVSRTPVVANRVIPGTGDAGGHQNLQMALAERMVAVTTECLLAAVLVETVI